MKNIQLYNEDNLEVMENKEYNEFVKKFEHKKTTDDCYTPVAVYDAVLSYVERKCDIKDLKVVRPFYPGGDYESFDYPDNCVVIDNPPFSIISKITRFYLERNIKFFLFAPHLTLFSSNNEATKIITNSLITYENGAKVPTAFLSNMFGDLAIIGCPELSQILKSVQNENKKNIPSYKYPNEVLTVSNVAQIVSRGGELVIHKNDLQYCKSLDSQKKYKKSIFGSGFLLSEKAAAEKAAAEKSTAKEIIEWKLSDREKQLIQNLSYKQGEEKLFESKQEKLEL